MVRKFSSLLALFHHGLRPLVRAVVRFDQAAVVRTVPGGCSENRNCWRRGKKEAMFRRIVGYVQQKMQRRTWNNIGGFISGIVPQKAQKSGSS